MLRRFVLFLFSLVLFHFAAAQQLRSIPVPGGRVTALATDGTGAVWYGGVKDGVIFRSDDGGQTGEIANWTQWLGSVRLIAVNPHNSDEVYIDGEKSTDGAQTWTRLSAPLIKLAINPRNPHVVYGIIGSPVARHVLVSRNAGSTWDTLFTFSRLVSLVRICPVDTAVLYAAADSGIFKSTDSGRNWARVFTREISEIQVAPSNNEVVYAADSPVRYLVQRLYKTTNAGADWFEVSDTSFMNEPINEIAVNPVNPNTLYLATGDYLRPQPGDVHKSTDGGLTWRRKGEGLPPRLNRFVYAIKTHPTRPDTVLAGTYGFGTYKTVTGGELWHQTNLTHTSILSVYLDPDSSSHIYVGTFDHGIQSTTDDGSTWRKIDAGVPRTVQTFFRSYRIDPNNRLVRYLTAGPYGVFKSTDGGAVWNFSGVPGGISTLAWELAVHPRSSDTVFVGQTGFMEKDLHRTTNGGASWSNLHLTNNESAVLKIIFNPDSPQIAYVGTSEQGIHKTTDNSVTWFTANNGLLITQPPYFSPVNGLCVRGDSSSVLYCAQRAGVLRTSTGGSLWVPIDSALRTLSTSPYFFDVALRPGSSILYAGLTFGSSYNDTLGGIFRTSDEGRTWTKLAFLPRFIVPYSLTVSPASPYGVFVATTYGLFYIVDSLLVAVCEGNRQLPKNFFLEPNYPNPFNATTYIRFHVPYSQFVELKVFDILGREVSTLLSEKVLPGVRTVLFENNRLSSGVYFVRLTGKTGAHTKAMVYLK